MRPRQNACLKYLRMPLRQNACLKYRTRVWVCENTYHLKAMGDVTACVRECVSMCMRDKKTRRCNLQSYTNDEAIRCQYGKYRQP